MNRELAGQVLQTFNFKVNEVLQSYIDTKIAETYKIMESLKLTEAEFRFAQGKIEALRQIRDIRQKAVATLEVKE